MKNNNDLNSSLFTVYLSHPVSGGLESEYTVITSNVISNLHGEILNKHTQLGSFLTPQGQAYMQDLYKENLPISNWGKAKLIYTLDVSLVDQADIIIFLFRKPSLGMGMELERAFSRESRGLKPGYIIGMIDKEYFSRLSWMVLGAFLNDINHNIDINDKADILKNFHGQKSQLIVYNNKLDFKNELNKKLAEFISK